MSALGYRTLELRERTPERSSVWPKVLEILWKEGVTKAHIAKDLHLPLDEIEALVGPLVAPGQEHESVYGKLSVVR